MSFPNKIAITALCAVLFLVTSCKRNNYDPGSVEATTLSQNDAMKALRDLKPVSQHFNVEAGMPTKIKGAQGTLFNFYVNSFKDKNGNILTSGTVDLEVIEMYSIGDMILGRTSTSTKDGILNSSGEVFVKATMNGQEVFANKYGIGFRSTGPVTPMGLYYGAAASADEVVRWEAVSGQNIVSAPVTIIDTPWAEYGKVAYYIFDSCTSFTYVNCDHPYSKDCAQTSITLKFPEGIHIASYDMMTVILPSENISIEVTPIGTLGTNIQSYNGFLPLGQNVKFLMIIPVATNKYYYCVREAILSDGLTLVMSPQLATASELKAKMKEL